LKRKSKVHKHMSFDSDIFERAEKEATAEDKSLNEWINGAIINEIQKIDKDRATEGAEEIEQEQQQQQQQAQQPQPTTITITLSLPDINQAVRYQITPFLQSYKTETDEDKEDIAVLLRSCRTLLGKVEFLYEGKNRLVEFGDISHLDPTEKIRQDGLRYH
jgi:hypothetical protein